MITMEENREKTTVRIEKEQRKVKETSGRITK